MKYKKLLAVSMAALMSLAVLAGCSSNKNGADANPSVGASSGESASSATSSAASSEGMKSGLLSTVHDAVKGLFGENYPAAMAIEDETQIKDTFGLSKDMYKEIVAEMPMMNTKVDTFIAVEAVEGKAEEVEKALNEYRNKLIKDKEEFPYLPEHLPKTKASQVVREGNYVFFVMLGDIPEDTEETKLQEAADAGVQKTVDAIKAALNK